MRAWESGQYPSRKAENQRANFWDYRLLSEHFKGSARRVQVAPAGEPHTNFALLPMMYDALPSTYLYFALPATFRPIVGRDANMAQTTSDLVCLTELRAEGNLSAS